MRVVDAKYAVLISTYLSRKNADSGADLERSAIQLVSRLPDETLCKLLGMREVSAVSICDTFIMCTHLRSLSLLLLSQSLQRLRQSTVNLIVSCGRRGLRHKCYRPPLIY